jgi:hypothetical protein
MNKPSTIKNTMFSFFLSSLFISFSNIGCRIYKNNTPPIPNLILGDKAILPWKLIAYSLYVCHGQEPVNHSHRYDVNSSNTTNSTLETKLYYNNSDRTSISTSVNKLGFGNNYSNEFSITPPNLPSYNFMYRNGGTYIPIKYEFVVGYPVTVSNIHSSEIPATTVCALCHKNSFGDYNYEDFGVYENDGQFLSSAMFYNGGDVNNELFGVCRMVNTSAEANMITQCQAMASVSTTA